MSRSGTGYDWEEEGYEREADPYHSHSRWQEGRYGSAPRGFVPPPRGEEHASYDDPRVPPPRDDRYEDRHDPRVPPPREARYDDEGDSRMYRREAEAANWRRETGPRNWERQGEEDWYRERERDRGRDWRDHPPHSRRVDYSPPPPRRDYSPPPRRRSRSRSRSPRRDASDYGLRFRAGGPEHGADRHPARGAPPVPRPGGHGAPAPRSPSKSPSPDPELAAFLAKKTSSHSASEAAARAARLAAGGALSGKSKREKEREEKEKKEKDEKEAMELAYKEFLDDMDTESTKRKTGTFGSAKEEEEDKAKRKVPLGFVKAGGEAYQPIVRAQNVPGPPHASSSVAPAPRAGLGARAFGEEDEEEANNGGAGDGWGPMSTGGGLGAKPTSRDSIAPRAPAFSSAKLATATAPLRPSGAGIGAGSGSATPSKSVVLPAGRVGAFGTEEEEDSPASNKRKDPPGKRKRLMDSFAGELARDQAERESRLKERIGAEGTSVSSLLAAESAPKGGSRPDTSDMTTTNVCVTNLPAEVPEAALGRFFSRWGDVGTAKIMYPREREANRQGLVGFVSYMKRSDAEYALREADGILWTGAGSFSGGPILRTGWGKAMPLPPTASFLQPSSAKIATSTARGASPTSTTVRARQRSPGSGPVPHRKPRPTASGSMPDLIKQVEEAVGASGMELIRDVAKRVVNHGDGYYLKAMRDNGTTDVKDKFAFMWDENLPAYHYYRTLVDPDHLPIIDAPPFADDGYLSLYSSDSEEGSEVERQRKLQKTDTLGPIARRRLEAMLRSITSRRERIARVMCFALERGAAADQISEVLVASLLQPGTPLARKLARLHAISDILHNSAVPLPNAWKYRAALEARLDAAFVHLGQTARVLGGRIRQEGFKEQVRSVLMLWEEWLVFTPDVCKRFRVKLDGNEEAHKEEHTAAMERTPDEDMRQGSSEGGSTRIRPAAHPGHVPLLG